MITGESKPVHKELAAKVVAGTINGDGSLRVRVTATGEQTALAGIMRLVEQAQQSKSSTQILADKAAGLVFFIALVGAGAASIGLVLAKRWPIRGLVPGVSVSGMDFPHAVC